MLEMMMIFEQKLKIGALVGLKCFSVCLNKNLSQFFTKAHLLFKMKSEFLQEHIQYF